MASSRINYIKNSIDTQPNNIWIERARLGDKGAQKRLFQHFFGYVMAIALRYMGSKEEAEEALNDTYLKVFSHLDQYDASYPLKGWIRSIVVNTCIDRLRKEKKGPVILRLDESLIGHLHDEAFDLDDGQAVLPLIQSLPP